MRWSQLKTRIEGTFADAVSGRLQVWSTRYRRAVHQYGESWVTVDGKKIATMANLRFDKLCYAAVLAGPSGRNEAERDLHEEGIFASWDLNDALFTYLTLSIDEVSNSENAIVRAFSMLDKRFGKRRLMAFDHRQEHSLVKQFYFFRCLAEGIEPRQYDDETGQVLHPRAAALATT